MLAPLMDESGAPHWRSRAPEWAWVHFESFPDFLGLVWSHIGLPAPTPAQVEIAHRLQYGMDTYEIAQGREAPAGPREDVIRAFRGLGKSYITCAFVIWRLMRNPRDEKVLVVSATGSKAKAFVSQLKGILESLPLVQWLLDGDRELGAFRRDMADMFDVAGASLSQSCSVRAAGITGQITGDRATTLVGDDIEIEGNSKTEDARQRILSVVRSDFVPITKTEHGKGDILLLGTPQTEESVYNVLVVEMGFRCFCIPARFPTADKLKNYTMQREDGTPVDILAPYLRHLHDTGKMPHGAATDSRFGEDELFSVESKGRSAFALQYMLDTSLSDAERYPLKQHDLIVFHVHPEKAPPLIQWGRHTDGKNLAKDIPNIGFSGDHFLRPLFVEADDWRPYEGGVLWVDPAGRGKDETAWAVVRTMNAMLFVVEVDGHQGDPREAMEKIAHCAKRHRIPVVEVEPNYGQGMWVAAFEPVLARVMNAKVRHASTEEREQRRLQYEVGGCSVMESEWAKGQKETRIIDTLEPVMTSHRLVVSEELVRREARAEEKNYSLLYQLTHITRERGALAHEDRLEALAGAVGHFITAVSADVDLARKAMEEDDWTREIEDFTDGGTRFTGGFSRDAFSAQRQVGSLRQQRLRRLRSSYRNSNGERDEVIQW